MNTLLRKLLILVAAVVAVIAIITVTLLVIINPDEYRETIEDALNGATGLQLEIAGGVAVTLQPYVGLILNDVRLRNPGRPQELASSSQVSLRVSPRELLSGRLLIEELQADDFHFNLYVDSDGNSLWMTDRLRQRTQAADSELESDNDAPLTTRFNFISIANASIDIQNLQQGYYYTIDDLNLSSQNTNATGNQFPVQASFQLAAPTAPAPWPITLTGNSRVDLKSGSIALTEIQLALTPARFEGEILWQDLFEEPGWQVQFTSSEFALDDLMDNLLTIPGENQRPQLPGISLDRAWQARIEASLRGDSRGAALTQLVATLGDMRLEAEADIRYANGLLPTNARFTIETGALDLSPYLSPEQESIEPSPGSPQAITGDTRSRSLLDLEIPSRLRADMNTQGSISLGSLFLGGVQFGNVNLFANLESGVLDVELQPTEALDGVVQGNLRINSVSARSELALDLYTSSIDIADLKLPLVVPGTFTGRLNQESHFSGTGRTVGEWLESFTGATSFSVTDSSVDIGIIKQVFSSIAALSPTGGTIQTWPDAIRVGEFSGYAIFEGGVDDSQQVKARLDNFDITGSGVFNLAEQRFDYDLLFTVLGDPLAQTIPINQRYHNVSWPVDCSAGFNEPVNRFCRPDLVQVREIFGQLESNILPSSMNEIMPDTMPEALRGSNPALLQNLFPPPAPAATEDPSPDLTPQPGQGIFQPAR